MQEDIVRQHSVSSFAANWLCNKLSLSHVCFASSAINGDHQRRRRDLNPRAAINDLLPFQGSPFSLLGTSPQKLTYDSIYKVRGEGISSGEGGIRTHAPLRTNGFQDRLVMTTSISLHIHFSVFATSLSDARCILSSNLFDVNTNFYIFSIFFKNTSATSRSSGVVILIF